MTRTTLALIAGVTAVAVVAGCGRKEAPGAAGGAKKLVIFSQCNNAEPYRAAQNAKMQELWARYPDVTLSITDAQQDNAKQISQIETAIRQKPALLIVAPNEPAPLTAVMKKAMDAGIPTICLERNILEPYYTTWIACDNKEIGRMAGQFIVEELTKKNGAPKGIVVELSGMKGIEAEVNRQGGAHEVWAKYPDIKVVANPVADWLQERAKVRMTEVLSAVPKIDVVYGHNDPMAIGAYLAAKEKGREKEMIFVGVDGLKSEDGGIKKVMDGILAATFIYPLCVDKAVEVGEKIIHDPTFKPEKVYTMKSEKITKENAAQVYGS
jgi:ribose transport system substrate-binding protein